MYEGEGLGIQLEAKCPKAWKSLGTTDLLHKHTALHLRLSSLPVLLLLGIQNIKSSTGWPNSLIASLGPEGKKQNKTKMKRIKTHKHHILHQ